MIVRLSRLQSRGSGCTTCGVWENNRRSFRLARVVAMAPCACARSERGAGRLGWSPPPSLWLEPVERSIGRLRRRTVENPRVTRIERPDPADGSSLTGPCTRPRSPGGPGGGYTREHEPPVVHDDAIQQAPMTCLWTARILLTVEKAPQL